MFGACEQTGRVVSLHGESLVLIVFWTDSGCADSCHTVRKPQGWG